MTKDKKKRDDDDDDSMKRFDRRMKGAWRNDTRQPASKISVGELNKIELDDSD